MPIRLKQNLYKIAGRCHALGWGLDWRIESAAIWCHNFWVNQLSIYRVRAKWSIWFDMGHCRPVGGYPYRLCRYQVHGAVGGYPYRLCRYQVHESKVYPTAVIVTYYYKPELGQVECLSDNQPGVWGFESHSTLSIPSVTLLFFKIMDEKQKKADWKLSSQLVFDLKLHWFMLLMMQVMPFDLQLLSDYLPSILVGRYDIKC
jgi:hypothetical protein